MKKFLLLLFAASFVINANTQPDDRSLNKGPRGRVYGKVIDEKTKKGLEAVSVLVVKKAGDNALLKDSVFAGMFTQANGDFSFDNIPLKDSLMLVITPLGYEKQESVIMMESGFAPELDLGNIAVATNVKVLENVTVTAERPTLEMGIDRRVFNVEKSIVATGGTAIDVMRNIPSVTVDVDGNVELRNASPQIFVDGRPTILTLDQIPADNIEKVELITNPSAKFDASSSAGIINVVLKKNRRIGLNGNASASVGTPKVLGANLSLNLRQGKFNFFVSGNYNRSGGNADGKSFRQNKVNGIIDSYFNQYSNNDRTRAFASVRFGVDYFLNNRNTISLSENIVNGKFANNEEQRQEYLDKFYRLTKTGYRTSDGNFGFNRANTQLVYTYKINASGHQLTADVNYNRGSHSNNSNILNYYYNPDGSEFAPTNRVRNDGNNNEEEITIQVDYANPFSENKKFETGIRSNIENSASVFNAFSVGSAGGETKLPLSNNYKFNEMVNAFYMTFSNKIKRFTYQAGLRAEISKFEGELVDKNEKFGYNYPEKFKNIWDALFPSLFLTQNLGEGQDIQLNYSRRIRRPNFWHLNPFIDINDPVNIRQGNPALRPEFTNSLELNYNKTYKSGNFLGSIYMRNTQGDITRYSDTITALQFQQLNNAAIDPNAILNTFINASYQNRLGLDLTLQQKIGKHLELVPNINIQYRKVDAGIEKLNISNQGWSFESKLIASYSIEAPRSWLFRNINLQLTGEYESPEVIAQGKRKERYSVDFAFRKDMFKDKKGTLTFSINDVFNSRRWGSIYDTDNFYQDSYRRWNVRNFRLTFSYRFGNAKFSLFKRNQRGDSRQDDDAGEGMQGM